VSHVIPPLGKLLPSDPPAKWKAFASALEDDDKTRRMRELIKANAWQAVVCLMLVLLIVVVLLIAALVMR
jgi:hypothetical protein